MKGRKWILVCMVILLAGWTGCSRNNQPGPRSTQDLPREAPNAYPNSNTLELTPVQESLVARIQQEGGLQAAVLRREEVTSTIINARTNPTMPAIRRFNLLLLDEISRLLSLPVTINEIGITEVFGKDGVIPKDVRSNPLISYTPDVFLNNHILVGSVTPLPWRTRLMGFVPVVPSHVVVLAREEFTGTRVSELGSLGMVIPPGSSYMEYYNRLSEIHGFEPNLRIAGEDFVQQVLDGRADATLTDAIEAVGQLRLHSGLTMLEGVTNIQYESWAVPKDALELNNLIRQALDHLKRAGLFDQLFLRSFGFDLKTYHMMIGFRPEDDVSQLSLTLEELDYIQGLQSRGGIRYATMVNPEGYLPREDGSITGFDYNLAISMARVLGLDWQFIVLPDIQAFFTHDGEFDPRVMQGAGVSYTPDIFRRADVLVAPFAVNEWRQRLARFITLYPAGIAIVGSHAQDIREFTDLEGLRVALPPGGFQEPLLEQLGAEHGFSVEYVYYPAEQDVFALLRAGRADVTIDGTVFLARGMQEIQGLSIAPLSLSLVPVGWAVAPENTILAGIIEKFLQLSLSTGSFNRFWTEAQGVDFDYYLRLVSGT
ncbi:type 2 periplasmic-binding domain-containing protein [Spirochaeta lutea]|uniref:Solute-binding protein family 3/N-terminal domain-containing protein n=1 Tax=Spirochaeta lutea TaxID=1480694 RepID=A0A098QYQ5_9SPIO|nr:transporter substrate-binding domain-containing protein [Spirochaeta lutea]KGE72661.1 hypothetical protein DC28_06300 [Spirochaeta lutea]